jgi:hypothetical protein
MGMIQCTEYVGSSYTVDNVKAHCVSADGNLTYVQSICPTARRIGSCLVNTGTPNAMIFRYYGDAAQTTWTQIVQNGCATGAKGTWTAN